MNSQLEHITLSCDLCVIGGGLSGTFAAIAAARLGAKVVLMQDRPMLGGNASSEIRMWVRGARGRFNMESGLVGELRERLHRYNPEMLPSKFDAILWDMVKENENITLLLNTSCLSAETNEGHIASVTGWQLTTYTYITVTADYFADCSGDSILAPLTGAAWRKGREAREEYGETIAQETADDKTMGLSVFLCARETDHPVSFTPPPFANVYESDADFSGVKGGHIKELGRGHDLRNGEENLWWIELGGDMDSLHDAECVRDELLRTVWGVWDHIKNRGDHGMENWELEWVGFLPGKRETGRYIGDYVMHEHDLTSGGHFPDEVAYGGWGMDDHNPAGMKRGVAATLITPVHEPYGIAYRSLYSVNIDNLFFAGRNISVTHIALSSTRVMATCAVIGQAVGTAAAIAAREGISPREVGAHIDELQQTLLTDGAFLPHIARRVSPLTRTATLNISDADRATLENGIERPRTALGENGIAMQTGDSLTFTFDSVKEVKGLRLRLDPDWDQNSVSHMPFIRDFPQKINTPAYAGSAHVAATIARDIAVEIDGAEVLRLTDNFRSVLNIPLTNGTALRNAETVTVRFLATHGAERFTLFAAEVY